MAHRKMDIGDFNARVQRIRSPKNKSYYDPDLGMHVPKRVPRDKITKTKPQEDPTFLSLFIVSAILGALGYFLAQIVRVHVFGPVGPEVATLALDLCLALWFIAMITALTGKRTIFDRLSQVAGVYAMIAAGHNLFWRWPDQMAMIFTPEHVESVRAVTTQMSVVVGANVISF